jgi:hypothetical protein
MNERELLFLDLKICATSRLHFRFLSLQPYFLGIGTGYELDRQGDGVRAQVKIRFFSALRRMGPNQPPVQFVSGNLFSDH